MTNKNNNEKFTVGFIDITDQTLSDTLEAFGNKAAEGGIVLRRSAAQTFGKAVTVEFTAVGYKAKLPETEALHRLIRDAAADLDVQCDATARGPVFNVTRPLAMA